MGPRPTGGTQVKCRLRVGAGRETWATRLRQTSHMQTQGCLRIPDWQGYIKKDTKKEMNKRFQNLKYLLEQGAG